MYHYIHDRVALPLPLPLPLPGNRLPPLAIKALTTSQFAAQLDDLMGVFEPIDWPTLYAWTQGRARIPRRSFLVTFDDGLKDHARYALPLLEERGIRGTFFVPGSVLTSHRLLSAHAQHLLFSVVDTEQFGHDLDETMKDDPSYDASWRKTLDQSAVDALYHYEKPDLAQLKYFLNMVMPPNQRNRAIDTLFKKYIGTPQRWAKDWYLGWDDMIEMDLQGHTIGGHGFLHEPYINMKAEARDVDLRKMAAVLRSGIGLDLRPMSYPFGRYDEALCQSCRNIGVAHAFTTESRWFTQNDDPLKIPRVDTIRVQSFIDREVACQQA